MEVPDPYYGGAKGFELVRGFMQACSHLSCPSLMNVPRTKCRAHDLQAPCMSMHAQADGMPGVWTENVTTTCICSSLVHDSGVGLAGGCM